MFVPPHLTVLGGDLEFPRVGATYRIQYPATLKMQDLPSVVTVVSHGPGGWHLVECNRPIGSPTKPVQQEWINFNLLVWADEEERVEPQKQVSEHFEKPIGIYP